MRTVNNWNYTWRRKIIYHLSLTLTIVNAKLLLRRIFMLIQVELVK